MYKITNSIKVISLLLTLNTLLLQVDAREGYKYLDLQGNLKELTNDAGTIEERDYSKGSINLQHKVQEEDNRLRFLDSKGGLTDVIDKGSTIEKRDYSKGTIEILNKVDE